MRRLGQDKLENAVIKYARSDVNSILKSENCRGDSLSRPPNHMVGLG